MGTGTTFHVTLPLAEAAREQDGEELSGTTREVPVPRKDAPTVADPAGGRDLSPSSEGQVASGSISAGDLVILVAEDEAINRLYLVRFLERAGVTVVAVDDGARAVEAVQAVQGRRFDVVLMDVSMPNMNGMEATKQIRLWEEEHGLSPQPIIALTAHAQSEHARQCVEAGMNGYVSKPYREHQIWEGIAEALGIEDPGLIHLS